MHAIYIYIYIYIYDFPNNSFKSSQDKISRDLPLHSFEGPFRTQSITKPYGNAGKACLSSAVC